MTAAPPGGTIVPISPAEISLHGIRPVPRVFHEDARGFLVETLRSDDPLDTGVAFRMSYTSLTRAGQYRDIDRWHVHRIQSDRFVVVLGEMILALLDRRPDSPTRDQIAVVRMVGSSDSVSGTAPGSTESGRYLVPIPPGVLHCIGNISRAPFVLQNFPTELYDPRDEGRVMFSELPVPALARPFSWDLVARSDAPR